MLFHSRFLFANKSVTVTAKQNKKLLLKYVPEMMIRDADKFTPIKRPNNVDPCYFGYFTEYAFKYYSGMNINKCAEKYLEKNPQATGLREIVMKQNKTPEDICKLCFCEKLIREKLFSERKAEEMINEVQINANYYENYFNTLPFQIGNEIEIPTLEYKGLCGVPDIITDRSIIELKCCKKDNINYFRLQLYLYAYLYYKSTGITISQCEVYNFFTGNRFVMEIGSFPKKFVSDLSKC